MKSMTDFLDLIDSQSELLSIDENMRDCWIEESEILPGSSKQDAKGFHYMDIKYRLVMVIDNLKSKHSLLLTLLVKKFFDSLDDNQQVSNPSVLPSAVDKKHVDIEITMDIKDSIYLVPVENSPIEINGQPMGIGDYEMGYAKKVTVNDHS